MFISPKGRLAWLDGARGCAALAVMAAHALDHYWGDYSDYLQFGNAAVVLFFLISGYIIPHSLEQTSLARFWIRRSFRLFPLYWITIALTLAQEYGPVRAPGAVLANLTMLQPYLGSDHVSSYFWSLTVELTFYVMLSLLSTVRLQRATTPLFLILAGTLLTLANLNARWVLDLNMIYLPVCVAGTLWYRYDRGGLGQRELLCLVLVLLLYLLALPVPSNWILGWILAVGVFAMLHARSQRLWPAALVWCGMVSYSIYLLHPLVLSWMPAWGALVTLGVASVSYQLIERPAICLGRRFEHWLANSIPAWLSENYPRPGDV
jgi:peptidoglycan/LPS O-acetylase OafA/YrhL